MLDSPSHSRADADHAVLKYRYNASLQERLVSYVVATLSTAARASPEELVQIRAILAHFVALTSANIFDVKRLAVIYAQYFTV